MELIKRLERRIDKIDNDRSVTKQALKKEVEVMNQSRQVQRESHAPTYKQSPSDNLGTGA